MKRINPRLLLCVAGGAALLCLVIWMAAVLLLPGIVRGKVLKQANIAGVDLSGVVVESVGLRGMVVRDVVAKGGNVRAVIPLLRADYSLPGIMKGDFNTASVSGSRVEVEIAGKAFLLTDLSGVLQMDESDTASADEWVFRGETRFEGNFLDLEARVNPKTGRGAATLRCRELAVASFLKFFDNSFTGLMNGNLEMVVEAEIDDWQLQKSRFVLDSKRLHIFYSGFETALALKAGGEADGAFESYSLHADVNLDRFEHDQLSISEPFEVRVDMDSETGMKAEFSSLAIHQPPGLTVDHLKAQMVAKPLSPEVRFSGDLTFHEISSLRRMPVIQFSGTAVSKAEGVEWTIEADTAGPIQAVLDETTLSAGIHAKLNASGVGEKGTARVHIQADNFRAGGG